MQMSDYQLDPTNDMSSLGLSWDSMLLMTGVKLELITDLIYVGHDRQRENAAG